MSSTGAAVRFTGRFPLRSKSARNGDVRMRRTSFSRGSPPTTGLVVVEVKRPDESLDDAADQALSYAVALRAALYFTCNGKAIQIWQSSWGAPSRLALDVSIENVAAEWGEIERLLSRASVFGFYESLAPERIRFGDFDQTSYLRGLQADVSRTPLCDRTVKTTGSDQCIRVWRQLRRWRLHRNHRNRRTRQILSARFARTRSTSTTRRWCERSRAHSVARKRRQRSRRVRGNCE